MRYDSITDLIGDTPLLRLDPAVHGLAGVQLYAKLESHNPFGSVKDRVAWAMIRDEVDEIAAAGRTLIEASSGNTAKALRVLGAMHGIELRAVTNRIKVGEVRDLLHLLGAEIEELPGLSECPDPTTPNDVYSVIESTMARQPGAYHHPSQYTNEKNIEAHFLGTGREIHEDLTADGGPGRIDYLVGGLGTTGSTRGAATYLRKHHPEMRTVGVVSERSDFIPGIRSETEMWDVGLFRPEFYDRVITVDSTAAIDGTLRLATGHGVLAGPTSGASYAAALEILGALDLSEREAPVVAVLVVCDRLEPYLSYIRKRRPDLFGRDDRRRAPTAEELRAAPELSPTELADLDRDGAPLIVDTRGAMAYRIGHVPGALNIRDDHLDDLFAHGIPFPRSRPVVFVCPVGEISRRFAALANARGYDAASLAGGIIAWRDAGLGLESGG
ncbi:pyridoxal-phosphate dependent enzyme [Nocardia bovistercoris]|uniref:Pyridoxal-phosphate dependent enzyme n=1 Tax=Nocardia bovistercoris TaxID=2785916 RepID=A0A931ICL2_9NOCA|nr:pyridoxal-phosphate dependent enzyme [Nocardia bovistercoris]MBH0779172.1 pyridoxal-phosphate dependent enzyme [Nocardia bovistercoris]